MTEFEQQLSRASSGVAQAQCKVAFMYDSGQGVEQDDNEAVRWYRLAAGQGYAEAQCNLGVSYEVGKGVERDEAEAATWYRLAAAQGYARAQCNLGRMYMSGRGVEEDFEEAVRWYRRAADQGDADAQWHVGHAYETGIGVEKDVKEAETWFRRAEIGRQARVSARGKKLADKAAKSYAQEEILPQHKYHDDMAGESYWCSAEDLDEGMTVRMPEGVGVIVEMDDDFLTVRWTEQNELTKAGFPKKRYQIKSLGNVEVLPDAPSEKASSEGVSESTSRVPSLWERLQKLFEEPKSDEPKSDELDWPWPITEAPEGVGGGVQFEHEASALKLMGYTVGKSQGKPPKARKDFLDAFFSNSLPGWVEKHFPGEYGMPGSEQRLRKMANVLAANTRNFKRNDRETYRFAISDWEEDLEYLKTNYYDGGSLYFPWPPIEPDY